MNDQFSNSKSLMVLITCLLITVSTFVTADTSICAVNAQISNQSESTSDAQKTDEYDDEEEDEEPDCD